MQKTPITSHSIISKTLSYIRNLFRSNSEAETFICGTALKDGYRRKQEQAKKYVPRKILIFQNDQFLLKIIEKAFARSGFTCIGFEHPTKDPISLVLKEKPDVILMNILMPVLDGFAASEMLLKDERTKNIPIVAWTNLGQPADIKQGLDMGMTDYLVAAHYKPQEVVNKVCDVLNIPHPPVPEESKFASDRT